METLTSQLMYMAYIGPGLSGGVIGVILGILASIGLAILAIVWYPLKRLIKGKKKSSAKTVGSEAADASSQPAAPTDPGKIS